MNLHSPIGLPTLLRKLNTTHVLRAIRTRGPLSRKEVAEATGLSQPTVNEISTGLVRAGIVIEETAQLPERPVKRGRRGSVLSFNASAGHVLGLDIAAESITAIVADLNGAIITREARPSGAADQLRPKLLMKRVRSVATSALSAAGVDRRSLMAVGVGVPGSVDPHSGLVRLVPALPGWEGHNVAQDLDRSMKCPVLVNNDMHLAMLAERRLGTAREGETAVYFHVGIGIGLGILIGGDIYTGAYGNAGEIALLPLRFDDAIPDLGFGAFEWGAGAMAIARLGHRLAERGEQGKKLRELAEGDLQRVDASIVFEAASRGDPGAQNIVETVADRLCAGIAAVNCILDPGNLILGGDLMKAGSPLPDLLRDRLTKLQPRPIRRVTTSLLGEDIVALGAVQLALQFVEQNHFGESRQDFPEVLPTKLRGPNLGRLE